MRLEPPQHRGESHDGIAQIAAEAERGLNPHAENSA